MPAEPEPVAELEIERSAVQAFDVEGRSLHEFLDWAAREGGWELRFADEALAAQASEAILHGSIKGLSLDEALPMLVAAAGLRYRLTDGVLLVEAPSAPPAGGQAG